MKALKKTLILACFALLLGMSFGSIPVQAQNFAYVTNQGSTPFQLYLSLGRSTGTT